MNRRTFIDSVSHGAALAGGALLLRGEAVAETQYPHATLADALAAAEFDPSAPGNFTCVWTADTHYGAGDPAGILRPVIEDGNAMEPAPAFLGIAGTVVVLGTIRQPGRATRSLTFGLRLGRLLPPLGQRGLVLRLPVRVVLARRVVPLHEGV